MLDIDIGRISNRGRRNATLHAEVVREISAMDLATRGEVGSVAPKIKKIRASHHYLAQQLAMGDLKQTEIAMTTGFSESRISILKNDPAFQELLAFYANQRKEAVADTLKQLSVLGHDALAELRDRLEDEPDSFSSRELLEIVKVMMDRTGHGPTTKIEAQVMHLTADQIARVRALAAERSGTLIEGKSEEIKGNDSEDRGSMGGGDVPASVAGGEAGRGARTGEEVRKVGGEVVEEAESERAAWW